MKINISMTHPRNAPSRADKTDRYMFANGLSLHAFRCTLPTSIEGIITPRSAMRVGGVAAEGPFSPYLLVYSHVQTPSWGNRLFPTFPDYFVPP